MNKLYLDFETRSKVDLTKVGAWAYASHPSTDIICMGLALNDKPVSVIRNAGKGLTLHEAAPGGWASEFDRIVAHGVQFEYAIYHFILHKRYGWPEMLDPSRWDCTMARALMCGLPAALEGVALALKLPFRKDLEGRSALLKICKPDPKTGEFNEDPALYQRVYAYNALDVEVERAADRALPELPPEERRVFEADLRVNRRGVLIDLASAARAQQIAADLTDGLNEDLRRLTGGAVSKASRVAELKRWVAAQGVKLPTVVKVDAETNEEEIKETLDIEAVRDLIKDPETPEIVKRVVGIRQQVGKSSVAKLKTMLACACADGRFRGAFQYHGAHTGRWAGRVLQLQNFPRGLDPAEQEAAVAMLAEGSDFFRAVYDGKSMQTLSDILRGLIVPAPGKVFVGGDYNAIECRVLNWLAGEAWVLALFARGETPYVAMAEAIYGRTGGISKKGTPREYDIGKRSELGGGFGMGWVRFQASTYTETSKRGDGLWLDDDLAQRIIRIYRERHPNVVSFWYATEAAALRAVAEPGKVFLTAGGRVLWGMSPDRRFLVCKLPSGRLLRYFRPSVVEGKKRDGSPKLELRYWTAAGEGAIRTDCNGFLGEYRTRGGELVENVVQAVARDIMVCGLLNVEAAGYPLVLHAHDELLAEMELSAPPSGASLGACMSPGVPLNLLLSLMEDAPAWAKGCPVKAEGWTGRRYRK